MIYIDSNFKCHTVNTDDNFKEINTNFFNDKCDIFIESYYFVSAGEFQTYDDDTVFNGEIISPFKPYDELKKVQREFELIILTQ